jgi:hypothetical protein
MMPDVRAHRRDKAIGAGDALAIIVCGGLSGLLVDMVHLANIPDEPVALVGGCLSMLIGGIIYALVS